MPHPLRRPLAAVALIVLALWTLTGCFRDDNAFRINADGTIEGGMAVSFEKYQLERFGLDPKAFAEKMAASARTRWEGDPVTVKTFARDGYIGYTVQITKPVTPKVFNTMGEDDTAGGELLYHVNKKGEHVFSGFVLMDEHTAFKTKQEFVDASLDYAQITNGRQLYVDLRRIDANYSVTFPGAVTFANGQQSGNTVSWLVPWGEKVKMRAIGAPVTAADEETTASAAPAAAGKSNRGKKTVIDPAAAPAVPPVDENSSSLNPKLLAAGGGLALVIAAGIAVAVTKRRGAGGKAGYDVMDDFVVTGRDTTVAVRDLETLSHLPPPPPS